MTGVPVCLGLTVAAGPGGAAVGEGGAEGGTKAEVGAGEAERLPAEFLESLSARDIVELFVGYDDSLWSADIQMEMWFDDPRHPAEGEQLIFRGRFVFGEGGRWARHGEQGLREETPEGEVRVWTVRTESASDGVREMRRDPETGDGLIVFDRGSQRGMLEIRAMLGRGFASRVQAPLWEQLGEYEATLRRLPDTPEGWLCVEVLRPPDGRHRAGSAVRLTVDAERDFGPRAIESVDLLTDVVTEGFYVDRFTERGGLWLPAEGRRVSNTIVSDEALMAAHSALEAAGLAERGRVMALGDGGERLAAARAIVAEALGNRKPSVESWRYWTEITSVSAVNDEVDESVFTMNYREGAEVGDAFSESTYVVRDGRLEPVEAVDAGAGRAGGRGAGVSDGSSDDRSREDG